MLPRSWIRVRRAHGEKGSVSRDLKEEEGCAPSGRKAETKTIMATQLDEVSLAHVLRVVLQRGPKIVSDQIANWSVCKIYGGQGSTFPRHAAWSSWRSQQDDSLARGHR